MLCNFAQMCSTTHLTNKEEGNVSTIAVISASSGVAQPLSEGLRAFLNVNGALYHPRGPTESGRVHLHSVNTGLSKEGQGLLLPADLRSAHGKGSTSPRYLKILSHIQFCCIQLKQEID